MPRGPVLTVIITSVNEGLDTGLKDAEKKIGGFGAAAGGALGTVAKFAAPIAGVAAAVAKLGAAGDKATTAYDSYATAMQAAGASTADLNGPLKDAIKGSKDLAFSGGETQTSLLALQNATGSTSKSIELLSVAQNVARLTGADLETASNAVAKAYRGNDRALMALIPGLKKGATATETIANANRAAAGQADNFAGSAEAMGIKTKAALKGIAITTGKALAPAFRTMLAALLPVIEALGKLISAILPVLIPLINAVAKGFSLAARAIATVVNWVTRLIEKIKQLLGPLNSAISKLKDLNPFKGAARSIMGQSAGAMTQAAAFGTTPFMVAPASGPVTINIYGDPAQIEARVVRALRGYQFRNGVGSIFNPGRR